MDLERRAGRCFHKQVVWWVTVSRRSGLAEMQQEPWFRDSSFARCSHRSLQGASKYSGIKMRPQTCRTGVILLKDWS